MTEYLKLVEKKVSAQHCDQKNLHGDLEGLYISISKGTWGLEI